ncbi:MAG: DUF370 domain-containing protein [Clostridia bacterium]|nr:DUF370 domain-containing protein [Oscillospiraceae bacterium]MBQ7033815.1 DUF370 domain-containing protein [Clostridia bacterium]
MYIHIGGETAVAKREIVGIMDMENTSTSRVTRDFLRKMEEEGKVITTSPDLPKSFVVTGEYVYITPVTAQTLEKRWKAWPAERKE